VTSRSLTRNALGGHCAAAAALWTGWHTFDLAGMPGSVVTIELRARRDDILMLWADYVLASLDRDRFRAWLIHPRVSLQVDEVEWSVHGGITYLTLGSEEEYGSYVVPAETIEYLTGVI
jgi:hypothetical protein